MLIFVLNLLKPMVLSETQNGFRAEFLKVMAALYDVGLAQQEQRLAKPNIFCISLIIRQRDKFLKVMAALYDVGLAQMQQRLAKPNILYSSLPFR